MLIYRNTEKKSSDWWWKEGCVYLCFYSILFRTHNYDRTYNGISCNTMMQWISVYWLALCQLDTGWSYHRKRSFSWGNASMRSSCKAFSQLVIKGEGPLVGVAIPDLVVLGSIREQAEQARGSKPVKNIFPWPLHQLLLPELSSSPDFLWWWMAKWKCKLNKTFPPQLAFGSWYLWRNRNPD